MCLCLHSKRGESDVTGESINRI